MSPTSSRRLVDSHDRSPRSVSPLTEKPVYLDRATFPEQAIIGLEDEWAETEDEAMTDSVSEVEDELPVRLRFQKSGTGNGLGSDVEDGENGQELAWNGDGEESHDLENRSAARIIKGSDVGISGDGATRVSMERELANELKDIWEKDRSS